ncbi:hypothetical protein JCM8547_002367 [Rhodosporidiobolus lusitaniae]
MSSRLPRVCLACHKRKVSCDLLRPTCTACKTYSRARPDHVCEYGPGAALPGESKREKDKSAPVEQEQKASLMPAKTRSATRMYREISYGEEVEEEVSEEAELEVMDEKPAEQGPSSEPSRRLAPPPLSLPPSFPVFPSTLPPLPPPEPQAQLSPLPSPHTPYFTSVFSSTPSPEMCSPPVLTPRPASGPRRLSLPDEALFDPAYLAAQRSFARLSVSPPSTAGAAKTYPAYLDPYEPDEDGLFSFI